MTTAMAGSRCATFCAGPGSARLTITDMTAGHCGERIETVDGLHALASRYDLALCDVWGVLHDGVTALPSAGDALSRFRAGGGRVVLVSNAPRPGESVLRMLDRLGVVRSAYDTIVTSGDLTRRIVSDRAGEIVHHVGPPRDRPIFAGLDAQFGSVEEAHYVVCSGLLDDDRDTVDDYAPALRRMRERDLPMICANPDLVVERGDRLIPCAGAIALAYERIGGAVHYPGKPHRPIYEAALAADPGDPAGRPAPLARVLAIGDALATDVAGARGYGLDCLMVARGIHAADLGATLDGMSEAAALDWLARQPVRPTSLCRALTW